MNKTYSIPDAVRWFLATAVAILSVFATAAAANGEKADAAIDSYYSANGLYNRKLYELAADEYKSFLTKYPNHEKALHAQLGLALSLYGIGKHADAEPLLAKLAANDKAPEQRQVHLLWGQCLLALDRAGDAEKSFLWGVGKAADPAAKESSLAGLIEALFRQQKWSDVVTRSDELVKLAPKGQFSTRARFQGGLARYELKQYEAAAGVLGPLTSEVKDTPLAQQTVFLLAECKRELGDLDGAASQYDAAARKMKGAFTADALFRLGFVHFVQKKYDDAIDDFDELHAQHKDSPLAGQAGLYLGRAYLEKKDFQMAEAVLRPLTGQPDTAAEAILWLGKTFLRQDKFAESAKVIAPALPQLAKDPLLPDLLFDYANALMGQEKFEDATKPFARLSTEFAQAPQAADAMRLWAFCLHRAKKFQESFDLCGKFLAKFAQDKNAADVSFLSAENLFLIEKLDDAVAAYRKFVATYKDSPHADSARFRVGLALYQQQKWPEAFKEFSPLADKKLDGPFFAQIQYVAGDCCFSVNDWDGAIAHFGRFVSEQPKEANVDTALLKLGFAYDHKGDRDKAADALQKLVSEHDKSVHLPLALVELGRLRYEGGQHGPARQALEQVVQKFADSPMRPQAEYYLGWVSLAAKKDAEAVEHFAAVADKYPKHALAPDARLQQAMILVQ